MSRLSRVECSELVELDDGLFNSLTINDTEQFYKDLNYNFKINLSNDQFNIAETFDYIINKIHKWKPPSPLKYFISTDPNNVIFTLDNFPKKWFMLKSLYDTIKTYFNPLNDTYSFDYIILCCLIRYQTLASGANQFVVDLNYKKILKNEMEFNFEGFGSVFNRYFSNFCSMFYDIEKYFGSCGSFFCVGVPDGVNVMLNPPYDEDLLRRMYHKAKSIYLNNKKSIVLMSVPDWKDFDLIAEIEFDHLYILKATILEKFHTDYNKDIKVDIPQYINYVFAHDVPPKFYSFYKSKFK
jgi:hypothetical protein